MLFSFFAFPVDTDSIDDDTDEEGNTSGEQFGLKPPSLIKQLKNILEQYPDNGQIIKVREHIYCRNMISAGTFADF